MRILPIAAIMSVLWCVPAVMAATTQADIDRADAAVTDAAAAAYQARLSVDQTFDASEKGKSLIQAVADAQLAKDQATTPQGRLDAGKRVTDAKRKLDAERAAAEDGDANVKAALAALATAKAKVADLRTARRKEMAAAAEAVQRARDAEVAALKAKLEQEAKDEEERFKNAPHATSMPLVGDETSIAAITADPRSFLGKEIILCGGARVEHYYNFSFSDAEDTHYSLRFVQANEKAEIVGSITMYALRADFKSLADKITKLQGLRAGKNFPFRAKVTVTARCFEDGTWGRSVELVDWQPLNSDRSGWGEWQSKTEPAATPHSQK
jgi:hypothetical protein